MIIAQEKNWQKSTSHKVNRIGSQPRSGSHDLEALKLLFCSFDGPERAATGKMLT